jgi:hypothetical protein
MSKVDYLVTKDNVTIVRNGTVLVVGRQHADSNGIINAIKAKNYDLAFDLADRATQLTKQSNGVFEVKNGVVYRNGLPVHNVVTERILQFQEQGLPYDPLVKFLENLMENPSARAINELYKFLENKNLPITEDGHFLAYKALKANYDSITSGNTQVRVSDDGGVTFRTVTGNVPNKVGSIIEVDRNAVDDDATRTCSYGLHAGALEYVDSFGRGDGKKVIVKINPKDAVSVPIDCDGQKLRASRYEVISDLQSAITQPLVNSDGSQRNDTQPIEDEDEDVCSDCGYDYYYDCDCDNEY